MKKLKSLNNKIWPLILKLTLFSFVGFIFLVLAIFVYYAKDLPRPEVFEERQLAQPTKIYDKKGETLLYTIYGEEKREIVKLKDLPAFLINAVLATEDARFHNHRGIDAKGVLRSILINLRIQKPIYGGSTISQQLIRSTFLTQEKSIARKIKEIILTLELERRYSKEQILEWYLNQIPFGPNIYGIQEASKSYFNKNARDLGISEGAILAGAIKAPSYYYPFGKNGEEPILQRKDYVLERMLKEGFISQEQFEQEKNTEIKFIKTFTGIKAPHFSLYVRDYLLKEFGENYLKENGLKVYTSLDWELQSAVEKIAKEEGERIKAYNANNLSIVVINPKTGEILSMIGSKNFFEKSYPEKCTPGLNCLFEPEVNVSIYGKGRQPGSSFKPFVYVTAFEKGYTPQTIVLDEATNFGKWGGRDYIPSNYDGKFRGPVTLKQALAQSLNIPAIKVLLYFSGIEQSIKTAQEMGITTLNQPSSFYGPALVLGGGEVKLLEMTSAYGIFAANGLKNQTVNVSKIENYKGEIIRELKINPKMVINPEYCEMINDVLSDNEARAPVFGSRSPLYFVDKWTAAKTGTTDNFRDGWTVGYNRSVVVGVWVGNNNNTPMKKVAAVSVAGQIWRRVIEEAMKKYP